MGRSLSRLSSACVLQYLRNPLTNAVVNVHPSPSSGSSHLSSQHTLIIRAAFPETMKDASAAVSVVRCANKVVSVLKCLKIAHVDNAVLHESEVADAYRLARFRSLTSRQDIHGDLH
ncbi:hypothetical protein CERSUDRAFT_101193 [Gelatoporia subvermispora B]|uniref:Uncharacterized protein n=1 Tax=Ceriporiopsis subvermispora (strain B) TaxID=914234 RepID=M2P5S2_CERS8|nr:hypothetical protein CERSUDRAFT_101193 [Gelatoporia subvermispora B]